MEAVDLICFKCKHYDPHGWGCKAFPEGIPDEITGGDNLHTEPLEDQDNELVFEPIETEQP